MPAHLATVDNSKRKPKSTFVRRYINLENGFIYKLVDDKYVKVDPKTVSKSSQGDDEYEFLIKMFFSKHFKDNDYDFCAEMLRSSIIDF